MWFTMIVRGGALHQNANGVKHYVQIPMHYWIHDKFPHAVRSGYGYSKNN